MDRGSYCKDGRPLKAIQGLPLISPSTEWKCVNQERTSSSNWKGLQRVEHKQRRTGKLEIPQNHLPAKRRAAKPGRDSPDKERPHRILRTGHEQIGRAS